MNKNNLVIGVALVALVAGVVIARFIHTDEPKTVVTRTTHAMPTQMVDFSLPDPEGKPHSISDWRGKTIILNFWATWCPPCRAEVPLFVEAQEKYKKDGLVIVGVAIDKKEDVANFIDSYFINYPVLVNDQENTQLMAQYGNRIATLPYSVIMDSSGRIVDSHAGAYRKADLYPLLDRVLNKK